jgi:hypothetical protein
MTIVVFGATGNIGQRIAREALNRHHEVIGVVREPAKVQTPDRRMTVLQGEATNAARVAALEHGADAIVSANLTAWRPAGLKPVTPCVPIPR